jgi:chaperonin cofactor prefoldin
MQAAIEYDLDKKLEELTFLDKKYENLKNRMFSLQKEMSETDTKRVTLQQEIHKFYLATAL